jgi:hypothetical protein
VRHVKVLPQQFGLRTFPRSGGPEQYDCRC